MRRDDGEELLFAVLLEAVVAEAVAVPEKEEDLPNRDEEEEDEDASRGFPLAPARRWEVCQIPKFSDSVHSSAHLRGWMHVCMYVCTKNVSHHQDQKAGGGR